MAQKYSEAKIGHRPNILLLLMAVFGHFCGSQGEPYYYLGCYTERLDVLTEEMFAKMPQTCVEFCEIKHTSYAIMSADKCYCTNNIILSDKLDNKFCVYRCRANKLEYCGGVEVLSYYTTKWTLDVSPVNLRLVNATENSLSLMWEAKQPNKALYASAEMPLPLMKVKNYIIKANIERTYSSLSLYSPPEFSVQHDQTKIELTDLYPATQYNISVSVLCEMEQQCGLSNVVASTLVGEPHPTPPQPIVLETTNTTITIHIQPIRNDNGPVSKVLIIVERVDDIISQPFQPNLLNNWQQAEEHGLPYYIAAELDYSQLNSNRTRTFIVGDGKRYGRYTNPPLDNTTSNIRISLGVVSTLNGVTRTLYTRSIPQEPIISSIESMMENFQYSTFEAGAQSLIALSVSCSIFGLCFIISVVTYMYLRYKTSQLRTVRSHSSHEMTMQQPIIEQENNGYLVEEDIPTSDSFKEQLNTMVKSLESSKRLPRNSIRMNANDVIAEGNYGKVLTGKLSFTNAAHKETVDCQLHNLNVNELSSADQAKLLREFRNIIKLEQHSNILDFYGVSAGSDLFCVLFEQQSVTLKYRLMESRKNSNTGRITSLSEQLILQWIYEMASAMEYLTKCKIMHKCLCSYNIYITADTKLKLSIFGPIPYANGQRKVDLTRWLAPEVLRYQNYWSKSDIWSFAVVAWECCTLGATPYAELTNSQHLLEALKTGMRPQQPAFVFDDIYQMLLNCWTLEPSERPSFDDLCYNVRQLMTSPRHALSFDRQSNQLSSNSMDGLPFYMPLLELEPL